MFRKSTNNANFQNILCAYMVVNPVTGRWALGWSMLSPSISHRYCCGVSSRASSPVLGHWKVPASNRLYNSRKPLPSQRRPLIRSEEALDPIPPSPTEQEQRIRKRLQLKLFLHNTRQSVDSPAEIRISQGDIYLAGVFTKHGPLPL